MTMKKMTKRDYYNQLLQVKEVKENSDLVEFINRELELLNRKNSKNGKPTKDQVANVAIQEEILKHLATLPTESVGVTISELCKVKQFQEYSNQKLSALVRQLVIAEKVARVEEKKVAYFSLVHEEELQEEE